MNRLLTTDLHLDDNPINEYRWMIFEHILSAVIQYRVGIVFILGDMVDRKDRFSAVFVNRLLMELRRIGSRAQVFILQGNHDKTMHPPSYFDFLAGSNPLMADVFYITAPTPVGDDLLLLPFSAMPKQDWSELNLGQYKAVFMHATVTGAETENGQIMENTNFPILPRSVKFYSGDIHVPQKVRNITYVGCPYPIKFGDKFPCRMLLLDDEYNISLEIPLNPPRKITADISSIAELQQVEVRHGDQVKLRFNLDAAQIEQWGETEQTIAEWARGKGITIAGTEIVVESVHSEHSINTDQEPMAILREFARNEDVNDELLAEGEALLREVL